MTKHIITLIAISFLILLFMFLPFLPGRYDGLSVTLSFMAQLFSFVGLLLVPLGVYWLWFENTKHKITRQSEKIIKRFTIATLITLGFIAIVVSLGAVTNYNLSFGILFLVFCFPFLIRAYIKLRRDGLRMNRAPVYLIIIPIVAALARFLFITPAVQYSRNYAIKRSETLIAAIETHYAEKGTYPISLQALHNDFSPGITGIKQYHYEQHGAAYNLYFTQFSDELDVDEIVMYNKLNEHAFAAHVLDILEYSGGELALRRGDRNRYGLSTPHWFYIRFE